MKVNLIIVLFLSLGRLIFAQDFVEFSQCENHFDSKFASVVDISSDFAIVGDPYSSEALSSAIIYKRKPDNTWQKFQELKMPNSSNFGQKVLISGDYVFVCANVDSSDNCVYFFKKQNNTFVFKQKIEPDIAQGGSAFGFAMDIDTINNFLAISAPNYDSVGKVFIYKYVNNSWQQYSSLSENVSNSNSNFGYALRMIGKELFVSAPFENVNYFNGNGKLYYYQYSDGAWIKKQTIISDNLNISQHFGFSLGLSGNMLLVSAPGNSSLAENAGCVYAFSKLADQWIQTQIIYDPETKVDDFFGYDISSSNSYLVVGSPYNNVSETSSVSGACFVYKKMNDVFLRVQKIYPKVSNKNGLFFGNSVRICDSTIVVGMPGNSYQTAYFFNSPVPFITKQPKDISDIKASDVVSFWTKANRAKSFQWQISNDNGAHFVDADNDDIYFNANTDSLIVKTSNILNGFLVRCKVCNKNGCSITDNARINLSYDNTLALVYPNPNNGIFKIRFFNDSLRNVSVTIFDNYKNIVYRSRVNDDLLQIDKSYLPRGIYLVAIREGKQKEIHKMMIIN